MLKSILVGGVLALLVPTLATCTSFAPCDAIAGNLLLNCGFETNGVFPDAFPSWTQTGNTDFTSQSGAFDGFLPGGGTLQPNSGAQYALLGPATDGFLSQTFATVPNDFYTIGWYLAVNGDPPNDFSATWGGTTIFSQTDIAASDWILYSFTEQATDASTTLTFGFSSASGYIALDDASVTAAAVPEPGSFALLGAALAGLLGFERRRRAQA